MNALRVSTPPAGAALALKKNIERKLNDFFAEFVNLERSSTQWFGFAADRYDGAAARKLLT